jgi:hypothetical protein
LFCYGGSDKQKADEGSEEEGGGDAIGKTGASDEDSKEEEDEDNFQGDEIHEIPTKKVFIVSMRYCTYPL